MRDRETSHRGEIDAHDLRTPGTRHGTMSGCETALVRPAAAPTPSAQRHILICLHLYRVVSKLVPSSQMDSFCLRSLPSKYSRFRPLASRS
jgi:hypothetical protein